MENILSAIVLPIVATVQTYLLEGKINLWFGPRVTIQSIVARYVEIALSNYFSYLGFIGLMDIDSNRGMKRGAVLFIIALVYARLFDDHKMRMDMWTSMTTVQLSQMSDAMSEWMLITREPQPEPQTEVPFFSLNNLYYHTIG